MRINAGDIIAIRGDKRINNNGQCAYTEDQLCMGFLRHQGHGGIWLGVVEKVSEDRIFVGGGWRSIDICEVIHPAVQAKGGEA